MRATIKVEDVAAAVEKISNATVELASMRGFKTLASNYEIVGVVMEEISLFTAAMLHGDAAAAHKKLIDVARAATFGVACQVAKTVDS